MKYLLFWIIATTGVAIGGSPTSADDTAGKRLEIECPMSVALTIKNAPEGWAPFVAPGASVQKFRSANVSKDGGDNLIGCFYDNAKDGFPPYALSRKVAGNFKCAVAPSASGFASRLINCTPLISVKPK